jgi:Zn-dependent M28 family amino/carboxypeptidase
VGFPAGSIALVQRGTCDFGVKADNAEAAGASGVVTFNRGTAGKTETLNGTLGHAVGIPAVGTRYAVGQELGASGTQVHLKTDTNENRTTYNVIAGTPPG